MNEIFFQLILLTRSDLDIHATETMEKIVRIKYFQGTLGHPVYKATDC